MNNLDRLVTKLDSILGVLLSIFISLILGLLIFWITSRPFEKLDLQIDEIQSTTYNQPLLIENPARSVVTLDGLIIYEAFIQSNGSYQLEFENGDQINFTIQIYDNRIPYILYGSLLASISMAVILFVRKRYLT